LLLVQGVTPELLYGNDLNRNGILEPNEDDGTGTVTPGWDAYLTVYSRSRNVDPNNNPKIWINNPDLNTLFAQLSPVVGNDLATYIIAYRMFGGSGGGGGGGGGSSSGSGSSSSGSGSSSSGSGSSSSGSGTGGSSSSTSQNSQAAPLVTSYMTQGVAAGGNITSLYALINSSVTVPNSSSSSSSSSTQPQSYTYGSPLSDPGTMQQYLPLLLTECTTQDAPEITPQININTAPQAVLNALPVLQPSDVQAIIAARPSFMDTTAPDPMFQTAAWLITQANLSPSKLQSLDPYITVGSQVYRVQAIAYHQKTGPSARLEAIVDLNAGRPRILAWKDLSQLGQGFNLQPQQ
jgi:DNA uptake protein ComE-like DNA-binding protein